MRRLVIPALLMAAGMALSGCAQRGSVDIQQAETCVAVATAVGPQGKAVSIRSIEPLDEIDNGVRVTFTAGGRRHLYFADCAFAGGPLESGRSTVIGVRNENGVLSDRQIIDLHRWFLDVDGDVAKAIAETDWKPPQIAVLDVAPPLPVGYALQQFINLLSLSALYAPLALAYALIHGLIRRINLAFGQIAMVGGFGTVFGIIAAIGGHVTGPLSVILIAFVFAEALAALWGWFIARTVVMPLAMAPSRPFIVATLGISLALSEALRLAQGPREVFVQPMLETPVVITAGEFPVVITQMRLVILVVAAAGIFWLLRMMRNSAFGRSWRATADDPVMAALCGIDTLGVTAATFILASGLAGASGAVLSLTYGGTNTSLGFIVGLKALLASLAGGAGSLSGAVMGGILIAAIETIWSGYLDSTTSDMAVLAAVTLLFLLRPNGLLGRGAALEEGRNPRLS